MCAGERGTEFCNTAATKTLLKTALAVSTRHASHVRSDLVCNRRDENRFSGKKPCKMVFVGVGYGTVLYFRVRGENHLYSWDTKQTFLEENFLIVRQAKDCRQITHVDVDNNGVLWVLESNIHDFIAGKVGCYGPSILLSPVYDTPTAVNNDCEQKDCILD